MEPRIVWQGALVTLLGFSGNALAALTAANVSANPAAAISAELTNCTVVDPNDLPSVRYRQARDRLSCIERVKAQAQSLAASNQIGGAATAEANSTLQQAADKTTNEKTTAAAEKSWGGMNWGIGIGYSFGTGPTRVASATIVNNVVRVSSDVTDSPKAFLETHYLFENKAGTSGLGPFVSIEAGTSGTVPIAVGAGLIFGWKDRDPKSSGGFLIGIGYEEQSGVQTLGDGINANQPLPSGETQIRYKTRSAGAIIVMLSRKFDISSSD